MFKKSVVFIFIIFFIRANGQDEMLKPLNGNPVLKRYIQQPGKNLHRKSGVADTLLLPFFDDFSKSTVFPDSIRWADKYAFINTDFPVRPPSIGVATLDALDSLGNPYFNIKAGSTGACDTLTSQPINLAGNSGANNIYLSFYYQTQGLSYYALSPTTDSLVVQFKTNGSKWITVWRRPGGGLSGFNAAIIKVDSAVYFHPGFQFRFINYQRYLGAIGQWHIDYVYLDRNRNARDTVFKDVALQNKPQSILQWYEEMPYVQYKGNETKENRNTPLSRLFNLDTVDRTVDIFTRTEFDQSNNVLANSIRSGLVIKGYKDSLFDFNTPVTAFQQSTDSAVFYVAEYLKITGANSTLANDSFVRRLNFANYYAYDDGTAETAYSIRFGAGKVAYKFRLNKPDTLRAISVFFAQAEDTIKKNFTLTVWRSITPGANFEDVAYRKTYSYPNYTDSINGFYTYLLDTAVAVKDSFYIGWSQTTDYTLNVGYDRNYLYDGKEIPNPALYYNTNNKWNTSTIPGTLMMRPHLGPMWVKDTIIASIDENLQIFYNIVNVYPNPAEELLNIELPNDQIYTYSISDIMGRELLKGGLAENHSLPISGLEQGVYFVTLQNQTKNSTYTAKFIKK